MKGKLLTLLIAALIFQTAKAQLNADFQAFNPTGCGPLTVMFQDSSIGNVTSWQWNFGDGSTSALENPTHVYFSPGSYTVSLTVWSGGSSNTETKSGFITVYSSPQLSSSSVPAQCNVCDGSATATVSGGTSPFTYLWNDSLAQTTQTATGLCYSLYEVMVTDSNGCAGNIAVQIVNSGNLSVSTSSTNVTCSGINNGTAAASPSGGSSPYTFLWSNNQITETITGLSAGTYSVTVTDSSGCISESETIVNNSSLNMVITKTNVTCNGNCDGTATVNISGGTTPYQQPLWSDGFTGGTHTGLCSGNYSVSITDNNGCSATATTTISEPSLLQVAVNPVDVSCNGICDGSAVASVSGGTFPYSYQWWNGIMCQATTCYDVCAGVYTLTVTDGAGCTDTTSFIVGTASTLTASVSFTDDSCGVGCDGSATANGQGGILPFTYQWSNGATTQMINSLCQGIYWVTLTDAGGCNAVLSDTIAGGINASITTSDVSCNGGDNGSATATPTSGTSPFSYQWSTTPVQDSSTATGLAAGNYSVTITDSTGCSAMMNTNITQPSELFILDTIKNVSCYGLNDGEICVGTYGGFSPYTYLWSNTNTTACATGLVIGTYGVTLTDNNGCNNTATLSITEPPELIVSIGNQDATCGCNGTATASVSGGIAPYSYLWSDGTTDTTIWQACTGNYNVTVTDASGCVATGFTIINSTPSIILNLNLTNTSCGVCNGESTINASGGVTPYTYIWSNGQSTPTATGFCAGTHSVTVTDSTGCTKDTSFVIGNSSGFSASLSSSNISCNGGNDGAASAIPTGGVLPYSYLWSNAQTDSTITGLSAGTISCTVTDAGGCAFPVSATITQPTALTVNLNVVNIGCGDTIGSITANAFGGAGGYQYSLDSGATWGGNNVFSNLDTGNYQVIIKDTNNCMDTLAASIGNTGSPVILSATVVNSSSCYYGNGYISLTATGGNSPYTYKWINPVLGWGQYKYSLAPGSYTAVAIDNSGCTDTSIIIVGNFCPDALITGYVFKDINANCTMDVGDSALFNWHVKAIGTGTYYGSVNSSGLYKIWVPAGNYSVSLVQKLFWDQNCPVSPTYYPVTAASQDTVDNINFGNQVSVYCPNLEVSIGSGNLRPCFNAIYTCSVQNTGSVAANNATVDVTLDNGVSYVSWWSYGNPGITLVSQTGNTLTFSVGTINPGQTKYFYINVFVDCSVPLGATKCVEAHAYPDSICTPVDSLWDKSSISVDGACQTDSLACFTIYNTGDPIDGDMDGTSQYRIYSNNILISTGTFQLAGGDSIEICWPANGNTIRLEADQRPGHPGNSQPQASVELCGDPVFSLGLITLVPQDDADDFIDIDCRLTTASYDPNDKAVQPEGLTQQYHFIDSIDILEYQVRFQNTGNDTAFNVYVYDTLPQFVDVGTFTGGASSHPYTYEIAGEGIVRFNFEYILLPDSNVNEPASHGFVKFQIRQKPGNIKGTKIENTAGIVFDFNEPVITNTVFSTVGNIDSLTIPSPVLYQKNVFVKVFPNPFTSSTTFEISARENGNNYRLEIFNLLGEKVNLPGEKYSKQFTVNMEGNSKGIYFYKIYSGNELISAGKLVMQ